MRDVGVVERVDSRKRIIAAFFARLDGRIAAGGQLANLVLHVGHSIGQDAKDVVGGAAAVRRLQVRKCLVGIVGAAHCTAGADGNAARRRFLFRQENLGSRIGGGDRGDGPGEAVSDHDDVKCFCERGNLAVGHGFVAHRLLILPWTMDCRRLQQEMSKAVRRPLPARRCALSLRFRTPRHDARVAPRYRPAQTMNLLGDHRRFQDWQR